MTYSLEIIASRWCLLGAVEKDTKYLSTLQVIEHAYTVVYVWIVEFLFTYLAAIIRFDSPQYTANSQLIHFLLY